jgi:uncharacterized GH25 family protein
MRRTRYLLAALLLGLCSTLAAHDLFLKLTDYMVSPNAAVRITALNGTFTSSSNAVARSRVADLSLVGPAGRERVDTARLSGAGTRTLITARTGASGTYLLGLSIHPSEITLEGPQFNAYLREEGLDHILEARRRAGELDRKATERYAKHVKVIFQAGDSRSDRYGTVLGYPVEIVPLQNPYTLRAGDTLKLRLLVNGAPAAGIEALAGGRALAGGPLRTQHLRADADGVVPVLLSSAGTWYVKFISMTRVSEPKLDYVSQWATITFAILRTARKAQ